MDAGVSIYPIRFIFFFALFPVAFFWLRRAWRISVKKDYTEVALKKGLPAPNAKQYAPYELAINATAGAVIVAVIVAILLGLLDYSTWVAIAGSTLWLKLFSSFALSRHAHGIAPARTNKTS